MDCEFSGEIWTWRGPAPYFFLSVPPEECAEIEELARAVTYGWGMIPVRVTLGASSWQTSLWPKDGGYVVPLKTVVRRSEQLDEGDTVTVRLTVLV